jgi:PKD repeat protein
LNATNDGGSSLKTKYITVYNRTSVDFSASNTSGMRPLVVNFTDISTNSTSWSWDFGEGNTSTDRHPTFIYNVVGNFTVSHTASNIYNSTTITKDYYINVSEAPIPTPPVANFVMNISFGASPLAVQFTDTSSNLPTSWNWSFAGNYSDVQNPIYTFVGAGNYSVTLNVSNMDGFDSITKYVEVIEPGLPPIANFTMNVTFGYAPLPVQFNDTSINATSWNWSFGNGNYSNAQNPVFTYLIGGTFTITLNASNMYGSDLFQRVVFVATSGGNVSNVTGGGGGGTSNPIPLVDFNTMLSFGVISVPAVMIMSYLIYTGRKKEGEENV